MGEVRYCYICAARRSGSTFFDLLLGGHSQIASLGEFSFLGKALALDQICGCGEPLISCPEWDKVFSRIRDERGFDLRESPYAIRQWDTRAVHLIDKNQQTPAYLLGASMRSKWMFFRASVPKRMRHWIPMPPSLQRGLTDTFYLYDVIRETWGSQVVVDSSKNIFKALSLYERDPEHVRIVLLTRDGRGVFHSRLKTGRSRTDSIGPWIRYHWLVERLVKKQVAAEHFKSVRYEELARDTAGTLEAMCEFLGVSFEASMVDLSAGDRHVVNGNRKATFTRGEGIRYDERWKKGLSSSDLAYFERRGGRLNAELGYETQADG